MHHSTYFDFILTLPLLWGIYRGFSKGLIIELASVAALVFGVYGALKFSGIISDFLREKLNFTSEYLSLISFGVTFILLVTGVYLIAKILETIVNIAALKLINKVGGAVFGFLKTGVIMLILVMIIKIFDEKFQLVPLEIKSDSYFFKLSGKIPLIEDELKRVNIPPIPGQF